MSAAKGQLRLTAAEAIERLADMSEKRARRDLIRSMPELRTPEFVDQLHDAVVQMVRVDVRRAERLAQLAVWIANGLDDDCAKAKASRAEGHVLYMLGNCRGALARYKVAIEYLEKSDREMDLARTLSGALQTLILLGRYDEAIGWANRAREIFARHGARLRLARLDVNLANLHHRRDNFREALQLYRRAHAELLQVGQPEDISAVLSNMAVCLVGINDFDAALQMYKDARVFCAEHGMTLLVAQADYNIAYLHYLRGEYRTAMSLYAAARRRARESDDPYHLALCDLDESEMYLELNAPDESIALGTRALIGFRELQMPYETAKATTYVAMAYAYKGALARSLTLFDDARELFAAEENPVWVALIDLYKAFVLDESKDLGDATRLCKSALGVFRRAGLATRSAQCELLLARLQFRSGNADRAIRTCRAALKRVSDVNAPAISYQANALIGEIHESRRDPASAYASYLEAHAQIERLRTHVATDELRISFLKNKLAVYENLVYLSLTANVGDRDETFAFIEGAKSRSLAESLAFSGPSFSREWASSAPPPIEFSAPPGESISSDRVTDLRRRVQAQARMTAPAHERASRVEDAIARGESPADLDSIRATLPDHSAILEYYFARERVFACILTRHSAEFLMLDSEKSRLEELLSLLQFQLAKHHLGAEYVAAFESTLMAATLSHLRELYTLLIEPVRDKLRVSRLVIVPHGCLHYLPFHALFDGTRFLVDDFNVSYAPSATVYHLCASKEPGNARGSLVMGVRDPLLPQVETEVAAVAESVPDPVVLMDEQATERRLREFGPGSQFIHIATHGSFRQDNPLLSSVRLGDSELRLLDLYTLRLNADLITLSGCGTGLNVVVGADEIVGLVRGLLSAGARSALVTLWDVNDASTAEFMSAFYTNLRQGLDCGAALRYTMGAIRNRYPHPYFWAPFVLVGAQ